MAAEGTHPSIRIAGDEGRQPLRSPRGLWALRSNAGCRKPCAEWSKKNRIFSSPRRARPRGQPRSGAEGSSAPGSRFWLEAASVAGRHELHLLRREAVSVLLGWATRGHSRGEKGDLGRLGEAASALREAGPHPELSVLAHDAGHEILRDPAADAAEDLELGRHRTSAGLGELDDLSLIHISEPTRLLS